MSRGPVLPIGAHAKTFTYMSTSGSTSSLLHCLYLTVSFSLFPFFSISSSTLDGHAGDVMDAFKSTDGSGDITNVGTCKTMHAYVEAPVPHHPKTRKCEMLANLFVVHESVTEITVSMKEVVTMDGTVSSWQRSSIANASDTCGWNGAFYTGWNNPQQ